MNDTQLQDAISSTLRARASADVDTARLLHQTGSRGRALIRRRRRMVVAGAATGAVLVMAGAVVAASGMQGADTTAAVSSSRPQIPAGPVPPLPAALGEPGAAQRPDLVGQDPTTLHFAFDMPPNTLSVNWRVVDGFEEVDALLNHATEGTEGPGGLTIGVARDIGVLDRADTLRGLKLDGAPVTEPITVGGRPATLEQLRLADSSGASKWLLRWQPVNGLWVRINVGGHVSRDEVLGMADLLRRLLGTARPSAGFE